MEPHVGASSSRITLRELAESLREDADCACGVNFGDDDDCGTEFCPCAGDDCWRCAALMALANADEAATPPPGVGELSPETPEQEAMRVLTVVGQRRGLKGCDGGGTDEPCYFPRCLADGCDGDGEFPPPPPEECIEDGCQREPLHSYQFCHEHLNIARAKDGLPLVDERGRPSTPDGGEGT